MYTLLAQVNTSLEHIECGLVQVHIQFNKQNNFSGNQLYRQFKRQGLQDIQVETCPMFTTHYGVVRLTVRMGGIGRVTVARSIVSEKEYRQWRASLGMILVAERKG
jgi:hypothetical protein